MKTSPRLIDQGQRPESCDPLIRMERVIDRRSKRLGVGSRNRAAMKLTIGEPRAVRQQIAECDRPLSRIALVERTVRVGEDTKIRELWRIPGDRLVETK